MNKTRVAFDDDTAIAELTSALSVVPWHQTTICCVGTDRSTGDALGPIIGSRLIDAGVSIPIIGTLDDPLHAVNMAQRLSEINTPYIFAIDACLGKFDHVGHITFDDEPLRPGAGVNKALPEFGDWCMTGVVNVCGFMEYFVLQNTRLGTVMRMADIMTTAIHESICATPMIDVAYAAEVAMQ